MALKSMTGFGRGEAAGRGWKAEVEMSAVNRKQFDVQVSLPRTLAAMEALIYDTIHHRISRGSVTVTVRVNAAGDGSRNSGGVDEALAAAYLRDVRRVAGRLGLRDDLTASTLTGLPDVLQRKGSPDNVQKVWPLVRKALGAAIGCLCRMREAEGAALQSDIGRRFGRLKNILEGVRKAAPCVLARYRAGLEERLAEAGVDTKQGDTAFHREIVVFTDRSNISEEIVRLDSHFEQAGELLCAAKPAGRTLDFLCQEMFREINTIGSKANDARISRHVVEFKTELECVREQVQNVE